MTDRPTKAALRIQAAERRAKAAGANPLAGETLAAAFSQQLVPGPGAVVSGYWPFRSEIDPRPLMERLARLGARLALPVTPARGSHEPLSFRVWTPESVLEPGTFKVHEPHPDAEAVEPDLMLVPLLAFDPYGHRLGYGAGHFDRTLHRLRALKPLTAVGLAYAAQGLARLPADPHDEKLDGIATERGYSPVRKDDL
jgi:5-formyltetrahydrofolate cyclo-ligase